MITLPPIYVLTSTRRPSLTVESLGEIPHVAYVSPDNAPADVALSPMYSGLRAVGHYNAFRGHQALMKRFLVEHPDAPVGLFFEDDASPNVSEWKEIVLAAVSQMQITSDLEVFFLYGRQFERERFDCRASVAGREVLTLKPGLGSESEYGGRHHVYGSLAYLVTRAAAQRFSEMDWEGIPVDIILPDRFNFAFLDPSPFDHDRTQGSLIEVRNTRIGPDASGRVPFTPAEVEEASIALDELLPKP